MRRPIAIATAASLLLALIAPTALLAERQTVVIPADTVIYAELVRDVSSRKKETAVGDIVPARVYRDVAVDGRVVIAEGAELLLRVGHVKKARFLGRRGHLVLEAVSVRAVDGSDIPLDGYQYRGGKGRKAVTAALTVAVAWPFLFLRGKNAVAPAGTVLEARLDDDVAVSLGAAPAAGAFAAMP